MNKEKREAIQRRITDIAEKNGGKITPDMVVADAKKASSPLHDQFDWNDKTAAEKYRKQVARQLIRSVKIEIETDTRIVSTVCYVRDPEVGDEQGYVDVGVLRNDEDLAREALTSELGRATALFDRAESLALSLGLLNELGDIRERIEKLKGMLSLAA